MTKPTIDEALASSDPWRLDDDPAVRARVERTIAESRARAPQGAARSRFARRIGLGSAIGLGALAVTGGALAVDSALFPDLTVPIEYTTATGIEVSCSAHIEGGSVFAADSAAVVDHLVEQGLSGIGQRIHDHALVLTGDAPASPANMPLSSTWVPGEGDWLEDRDAFNMSLVQYLLIDTAISLDLAETDDGWLTTDCTGQLR